MQAPRWVVARALAIYQTAVSGSLAGGSWLWGSLTEHSGLPTALCASSVVLILSAAIRLRFRLLSTSALDLDPLGRWREPNILLEIEPRSGPVVITMAFRIAASNIPEFLTLMAERRRVRRRDGPLDWSMHQDLADPEAWTERYRSPTWIEYVRQNSRLTQADGAIGPALCALHKGPELPVVNRTIER